MLNKDMVIVELSKFMDIRTVFLDYQSKKLRSFLVKELAIKAD